jgi:succinate dehydrogenase/fumarate reductase cytochrome b subunit
MIGSNVEAGDPVRSSHEEFKLSNMETERPNQEHKLAAERKGQNLVRKLQAITGLIIALFVSAHSINHFAMHFGLEKHRKLMNLLRSVYTYPPLERILLGSIALHSTLALYQYKGVAKDWSRLLFQAAGWFQLMFVPLHIFKARFEGVENLMKQYDVTHVTISMRLLPLIMIPYFSLLSFTGVVHMIGGLGKAGAVLRLKLLSQIPNRGKYFLILASILGCVAISSTLALSGAYFRYPILDQDVVVKHFLQHIPPFVSRRIRLDDGKWFANIRLFG